MKSTKELIAEVDAELNAVKAADMGLEAVIAFVTEAYNQLNLGDVVKAKEAIDNLHAMLPALRAAVPANVVPATAGPVGKSPHEQYLEQARAIVEESLTRMRESLTGVNEVLKGVNDAMQHAVVASAAIQSPDLKDAA